MLQQFIVSFLASAAFSVLFSVPRRFLFSCGIVGMTGWGLYIALTQLGLSSVPATLLSVFVLTSLSLLFARLHKAPATVFSVAGIIPLVPGGFSYDAMRYFVQNDYNLAIQYSAKALMIAGAIAMGLILAEVFSQILKRQRRAY